MEKLQTIKTMIGYDADMREVVKFSNTTLKEIEMIAETVKAMSSLGTTVAEFTHAMHYMISLMTDEISFTSQDEQSDNLLRPVTNDIFENPNQKIDYEIFDQKDELYIIPTDCKNIFLEEIL